MQIDEVVWQVINNGHCSFKVKTVAQTFCRNEYNVTGLCSRQSCPLANSQYATIKEEKGLCYLFVKTAERAQKPNELWEKILLSKNYDQALEQIDKELQYWSNFQVHKNKQRLTKLRQMLIRMRKMRIKGFKELIPIKKKAERRDKIRESKALIAANLEDTIEKELIERLKHGVYDGVVNYNFKAFNKILDDNRIEDDAEREQNELEEEEEDCSEEELIFDPEDLEGDSDEEVAEDDKPFNFAKARKTKLQYEEENEDEGPRRKHKATDF